MELNQAYVFYIFILTGFLLGIIFDIFRILRKSFKTSDVITYIQDIIFWLIAGFILVYTIYKFNNGELRSYVILGIFIGLVVYLIVLSKIFIKINVKIITFIKTIISKIIFILLYPIKLLLKLIRKAILKPISFIFINIRKNVNCSLNKMSKFKINSILIKKKPKKA